jgi:hypothetical protein
MQCFHSSIELTGIKGLHTAFSPCQCIIAVRKDDGSVELKNVEYTQGPLAELKEDGSKLRPDLVRSLNTHCL